MTQEEEILIKDLSARLPYGVYCKMSADGVSITEKLQLGGFGQMCYGRLDVKPYLRPMSSMTEEEKDEINSIINEFGDKWFDAESKQHRWNATFWEASEIVNYLNAHFFDYRGLIEKGLAIEVTEENNPYK